MSMHDVYAHVYTHIYAHAYAHVYEQACYHVHTPGGVRDQPSDGRVRQWHGPGLARRSVALLTAFDNL